MLTIWIFQNELSYQASKSLLSFKLKKSLTPLLYMTVIIHDCNRKQIRGFQYFSGVKICAANFEESQTDHLSLWQWASNDLHEVIRYWGNYRNITCCVTVHLFIIALASGSPSAWFFLSSKPLKIQCNAIKHILQSAVHLQHGFSHYLLFHWMGLALSGWYEYGWL